jgi:hypothetical protein
MSANSVLQPNTKKPAHYYRCPTRQERGGEACPDARHLSADKVEPEVWRFVADLLTEPDRLRAALKGMIDLQRAGERGDPGREAEKWLGELSAADQKRARFHHAYAEGAINLDDLKSRLTELDEARETAECGLRSARERQR